MSARENGCECQWEIGDSPCPVHPTCEKCELLIADGCKCSAAKPIRTVLSVLADAAAGIAPAWLCVDCGNRNPKGSSDYCGACGKHVISGEVSP